MSVGLVKFRGGLLGTNGGLATSTDAGLATSPANCCCFCTQTYILIEAIGCIVDLVPPPTSADATCRAYWTIYDTPPPAPENLHSSLWIWQLPCRDWDAPPRDPDGFEELNFGANMDDQVRAACPGSQALIDPIIGRFSQDNGWATGDDGAFLRSILALSETVGVPPIGGIVVVNKFLGWLNCFPECPNT